MICLVTASCSTIEDWWGDEQQQELFEAEIDVFEPPVAEETDLTHPKHPTAWNTKSMLLLTALPPQDDIIVCQQKLRAITSEVLNADDLRLGARELYLEAYQDQIVYHWCFYQTVVELDEILKNDYMQMPFEQRNKIFLSEMKGLWMLALSLDRVARSGQYFEYLRKRYVDMNREYFARDVDILGKPFGSRAPSVVGKRERRSKPAGRAPVE